MSVWVDIESQTRTSHHSHISIAETWRTKRVCASPLWVLLTWSPQDEDEELSPRRLVAAVNGHGPQHGHLKQSLTKQQQQQQQITHRTSKPGQSQRPLIQKQPVYDQVDGYYDEYDERIKNFINRNNVSKKAGVPAKPHQVQDQTRRPPQAVTDRHGSDTVRSIDSDDTAESRRRETAGYSNKHQVLVSLQ